MGRFGWLKNLVHVARRLFLPLALLFLVLAAFAARDVVAVTLTQARPGPLVLTVMAWSMLSLMVPVTSWLVLAGMGTGIGYRTVLRIHVSRLPARYLPGGVWQTVSRMVDLHALGVTKAQLSVLVAMENLAPLATALVLGGFAAWFAAGSELPASAIVIVGMLIGASLPLGLRRFLRQAPLPLRHYLLALASMVVFWAVATASFISYWSAFPTMPLMAGIPELAASYLLAWSAGFVAFFAPQGIGVFEAVAGLLLDGAVPLAGVAVMVAGFRAATLAGDGLAYAAGLLVGWATAGPPRHH
jgi:hypothetical protein